MAEQRVVIETEKIVNGDDDLGELSTRLANVRSQIKALTAVEDSLVTTLRERLGLEPSKRAVPSSVAGVVNGVPVVSASSFTRTSVDGNKLRRLYPEIYTECARQTVVTTVRSQIGGDE